MDKARGHFQAMQPSPTLSEGPMTPSRLPARTCFNKYFAPIGPGSSRGALFNMSSSAIGAGLLSLPYAVSHCGLLLGLVLIVLGAISSALYYRIVIKGMDDSNINTFIDLASKLFGNCAKVAVEILIIVTLFGLICAYLVTFTQTIVCNYVCQIFVDFGLLKSHEYDDYRILVTIGITILILIPLSIPRNITSLRYLSTICIVAVLYIVVVSIIETIIDISNGDDKFSKLEWIKFNKDLPNAVTIIFFSFNAITTVPMVYSELQNRSYKKMSKIINRSIFMSCVLYLLLGTFGYLSDPVNTPKLITDDTNSKEINIAMIVAKFLICFALVGSMSLAHFPLRLTTEQMIAGSKLNESPLRYWMINFSLLIGSLVLALLVPNAVIYFQFIGGVCAIPLAVGVPTFIYWKTADNYAVVIIVSIWSLFVIICGGFSAVFSVIYYEN